MPIAWSAEADHIAHALGGRRTGDGWLCRCPVSSHGRGRGDRNPSLLVKNGDASLLIVCFAGCERSEVIDELRRRGLLGGYRYRHQVRSAARPVEPDPVAINIWRSAKPIISTLAEQYLEIHRGIPGPYPPSLRFTPLLRVFPQRRSAPAFPALVAAVQDPNGKIMAVQATFLNYSTARKARGHGVPEDGRKTFGALLNGSVRLGAASDVLGLAEGTESALAATYLTGVPCWATLGGGRMHRVWVPPSVRELHIFGDDDAAGRVARQTVDVHRDLQIEVRLPPDGIGKDWADVAAERTPA